MKITLKSECVANDRAFKDCTVGAIYEAEFCENRSPACWTGIGELSK